MSCSLEGFGERGGGFWGWVDGKGEKDNPVELSSDTDDGFLSETETEIVTEAEWLKLEMRQRSLAVKGKILILGSVASRWKVFLMEDLCLSAEEVITVIEVQGLDVWKGVDWEKTWDMRLRELRDYVWWERAIYSKEYVWLDGEWYMVGDRWNSRCTDVVGSLMLFVVDGR